MAEKKPRWNVKTHGVCPFPSQYDVTETPVFVRTGSDSPIRQSKVLLLGADEEVPEGLSADTIVFQKK